MPRRRAAPRLYLDKSRGQWVIRDGGRFIRTGCAESALGDAEKQLAAYIGAKHQPERGPDPLIADVLLVYDREHLQHTATAADGLYRIKLLSGWWGDATVSAISPNACREYTSGRASLSGSRKDLECLRAAIRFWHKHYGPLATLPSIIFPPKEPPRERWLARGELARLLWAARRTEHLRRFILLAYYTGSRTKNILGLRWEQIDTNIGLLRRSGAISPDNSRKRAPPVRLGRRILAHIIRWHALDNGKTEHVIHFEGRPIARINKANGAFKRAARTAGLQGVTPHTLRHTCATHLMQAGVDIWEAAGFLGMTVETLTKRYGHHHPDHQKNAAEALSAPNRSRMQTKPLK